MAVAGVGRPGRQQQARGKQMQRAVNNVKVTLICAFVTILVIRGAVGGKLLAYGGGGGELDSDRAAAGAAVVEDIERILREIRSGDDEAELAAAEASAGAAETATPATASHTLGPRVTRWNARRRRWLYNNPGFPSRDARGNPRILLVTGSPAAPCDDPIGDHYLLKSTKNKIDYCRLHGIEIVHGMADLAGVGWGKLPLLRRLMLAHPEVEWLWWMDGDALFTDMAFELPLARYDGSNLVVHGHPYLLFERRSMAALNTGSFLLRNCQWSLQLLDAWVGKAPATAGEPDDDQAALIHLLVAEKPRWSEKVYLESEYHLHGNWAALVDRYEEMAAEHHPGLGDERWPLVTHFVGCDPCGGGGGEYPPERCLAGMERAFNFADDQVLRLYGFRHTSLASTEVRRSLRVANRTASLLEADEVDDRSRSETLGGIHQRLWTLLGFLS